jgi:RimJ/RimL family protein N-acetyltransferase
VDPINTLVLVLFDAHELRGAVELRSLQNAWCADAEVAFSVERRWQSRGIGTALMAEAVRASRRLAIEHIYLSCHVRNRPMQRIAEKMAAEMRFEDDECFAQLAVRRERATFPFSAPALECHPADYVVIDL